MATWRGQEYYERTTGAPNEQCAQDASHVLRVLDFPAAPTWEQRENIRRQFLGYATLRTVAGKKFISRLTPHFLPSPDSTQPPYLYAQSFVHSETVGAAEAEHTDQHADGDTTVLARWRAMVEYRTFPHDVKADDDILAVQGELFGYPDEGDALRRGWVNTRSIGKLVLPGGRVIAVRQGCLFFEGEMSGAVPAPTAEPVPVNETWGTVEYFWSCPVAAYPVGIVQSTLNSVNDLEFDGRAKGTLLFVGVRETLKRDPFGQWMQEVVYRFAWAPKYNGTTALGHNAILRVKDGTNIYKFITRKRDGTVDEAARLYPYNDMTKLFHPPQ